jgi:hypothetical protein
MSQGLDRAAILALFEALSAELAERGAQADVFLVGGAAIAVAYDSRRATRDLDAAFAPSDVVRAAAQRVAADAGLPPDWLNDAVKGFLPGEDPAAAVFFESDSLRVDVASPAYLLAMKLMSARPGVDFEDIKLLYRICGFTTVQEGLELVERAFPASRILPKTQYLLGELVDQLNSETTNRESGS